MNEKALKTLEYNKIINKLSSFSATPLGRELCDTLIPDFDYYSIKTNLLKTFISGLPIKDNTLFEQCSGATFN